MEVYRTLLFLLCLASSIQVVLCSHLSNYDTSGGQHHNNHVVPSRWQPNGVTGAADSTRSTGGTVVPAGKYPYIVAVLVDSAFMQQATIISKCYALTDLLNVKDVALPSIMLRSGSLDAMNGGTTHTLKNMLVNTDIALLVVTPPFIKGSGLPLPLPSATYAAGTSVTVISWGDNPSVLMEITTALTTSADCLVYAPAGSPFLCTLHHTTNALCSERDFGAPLVIDGKIAGVFYNFYCGGGVASEQVFTDIASLVDWINSSRQ